MVILSGSRINDYAVKCNDKFIRDFSINYITRQSEDGIYFDALVVIAFLKITKK